jgi:hypothetical protein
MPTRINGRVASRALQQRRDGLDRLSPVRLVGASLGIAEGRHDDSMAAALKPSATSAQVDGPTSGL